MNKCIPEPKCLTDFAVFFAPIIEIIFNVSDHFQAGCFAVSISGKNYYSVAVDESHEMVINARTKQAIHSFSPTALTALALYLPYRAETLHNLKTQFRDTSLSMT
jgi:hypothetical protein